MSISICVCPVSLHRSVLLYSQSWRNKGLLADLFTRVHNYTYKISLSLRGLILTSHVELEAIVRMSLFARKLIHWKICRTPRGAAWAQFNLVGVKNVNEHSLTSYHHSPWPQGLVFPSPRNSSAKCSWKNPQWKLLTSKKSVPGERTGLWEPAWGRDKSCIFGVAVGARWSEEENTGSPWGEMKQQPEPDSRAFPTLQWGDTTKRVTKYGSCCLFQTKASSSDSVLLCFKGSWDHCRTPQSSQKPFHAPPETTWILPRSAASGDGLQTSHLKELPRKRDFPSWFWAGEEGRGRKRHGCNPW